MSLDENAKSLTDPNFSKTGDSQPIADSAGGPSVDFTNATNDISKSARKTLGSYLSEKTTEKNKYPVSDSIPNASPYEVKSRGEDASLLDAGKNNQSHFATGDASKITLKSAGLGVKNASLQTNNNRQITFFTDSQINDVLSKNASDTSKLGHDLLKDVPEDAINPNVKINNPVSPRPGNNESPKGIKLLQHVHDQLKVGNMYSPDAGGPFVRNAGETNEELATHGIFSIQRNLGSFDINGKRVQVSDISAMTMALLLKSVGNIDAANTVLSTKSLSDISYTTLTPFLRPAQFGGTGIRITDYKFSSFAGVGGDRATLASYATGQADFGVTLVSDSGLLSKGSPPNNDNMPNLQSYPNNAGSFAQMNNFLEPFAISNRFSSVSMAILALSALLAILLVSLIFDAIAGNTQRLQKVGVAGRNPKQPNSLTLGKYNDGLSVELLDLLQITQTDYGFTSCVDAGLPLLFGIPPDKDPNDLSLTNPTTILNVAQNLFLGGGFYANLARRIIAESANVASSFTKVGTNVTQSIEGVLRGIANLLDSATYKFIMVAAGVGDAALKASFGQPNVEETERIFSKDQEQIESFELDAALTDSAKLGVYRRQLYRWGAKGVNTLSLQTFIASSNQLPGGIGKGINEGNRGLIPSRQSVELIENAIESEYMPFYIHDLRTHEVMSMPAFITDFGETFSANYNSVEGIGRQDSVKLYQKTDRAVTFGFMLVAFNESDQDHLWLTVNKLVAMCYPQYSAGRIRETVPDKENNVTRFIQPFSQVQAASPMVRLRLGDVFKSNYSKYGLARLFGTDSSALTRPTSASDDDPQEQYDKAEKKAENDVKNSFKKLIDEPNGYGSPKFAPGTELIKEKNGKDEVVTVVQCIPYVAAKTVNVYGKKTSSVQKPPQAGAAQPKVANETKRVKIGTKKLPAQQALIIVNSNGKVESFVPSVFKGFSENEIKKQAAFYPDVVSAKLKLQQSKTRLPRKEFYSSDNNAIVRSFESTRGRGVAGFITSLGLDYGMNNYPWSIEPGSRAPMIVKISLGFAPITDLPLGLDYDGVMRNPSHPVGNIAGGFGDPYYSLDTQKDKEGKEKEFLRPASLKSVNEKIGQSNARSKADEALKQKFEVSGNG